MNLSTSFILIILFIVVYIVIFEIYSVLFRITGLTKEKSKFQSISLLTNSGYSTSESEIIMSDKARRKIALSAMLTGYAFSVVIVSLLINVFLSLSLDEMKNSVVLISCCGGGLILLIIIVNLPFVKNSIDKSIEKIAIKVFKKGAKENVLTLLDNYGKDAIVEIYLNNIPEILYGKSLMESKIKDHYKMNFLMYNRKGKVHDITKDTIFQKGDVLLIFGSYQNIKDLFLTNAKNIEELLDSTEKDYQNEIDLIENYGGDAMAEITINTVPEFLNDMPLFKSNIKENYHLNVMMITRGDMPIIVSRDTMIKQYDKVVVFGPYQSIKDAFIIERKIN